MSYNYTSSLKQYIVPMVEQKHALGYPYTNSERFLYRFDQFCTIGFPYVETITPEVGNAWAVINPTENPRSFENRIAPVRELARFMNRMGIDAYIIPIELTPKKTQPRIPHIFSEKELELFFKAADSLVPTNRARLRHLQIPVFFRMMYTCGLRPREARLIQREHLDLQERTIFIPESKGHKDRMVVMSPEMARICSRYYVYAKQEFPDSPYLFPCQQKGGIAYAPSWVFDAFHMCLTGSGIGKVPGNAPRPYDFRHTFATHRIYRWMEEKKDLGVMLPYLSAYMGHVQFSDTAYYIHLVPDFFADMSGMDLNAFGGLIPEVPNED